MDYMAPWLFWLLFFVLWGTVIVLGVLNWRRAGARLNSHYPAPFVADPVETDIEDQRVLAVLRAEKVYSQPVYDQDKDTK